MNKQTLRQRILTLDTAVLGIMIFLRAIYFFVACSISTTWDSVEYIQINGFAWLSGELDRYRLPLYPMLIELCQRLLGSRALMGVGLIQLAVSFVSMAALLSMLKKLTKRPYLYIPIFVLCCVSEVMIGWDKIILTESLSLSLTVLMLWALVSYLKEPKLRYIVLAVVFAGLGAFLRAVFAVYVAAIFAFLALRLVFTGKKAPADRKSQRLTDGKGLAVAAVPIFLLIGYGLAFNAQYGAFTLSDSGLGQQLYMVLEQGYYQDSSDTELVNDANHILNSRTADEILAAREEALAALCGDGLTEEEKAAALAQLDAYLQDIPVMDQKYEDALDASFARLYGPDGNTERCKPLYRARCYIMDTYDRDRVAAFVNESLDAHGMVQLQYFSTFMLSSFSSGYTSIRSSMIGKLANIGSRLLISVPKLSLMHALLAAFIELAICLWILLRKKRLDWLHLGFGLLILATAVFSFLGTNAEFARTAVTAYPMLFPLLAIWLDKCVDRLRTRHP